MILISHLTQYFSIASFPKIGNYASDKFYFCGVTWLKVAWKINKQKKM